ncbi:MAG: CotH kinase family protein [Oscillospiraceae bacterium]|nr:CotH kinase family protein [Oscillospiraceae bacterium]
MKKKLLSLILVLCMLITLAPALAMPAMAEETETATEGDFSAVFKAELTVKKSAEASLPGDVKVSFDLLHFTGTVYLPGGADAEKLFLSWDDSELCLERDGVSYESGTAPIAPAGQCVAYTVSKGLARGVAVIKTLQGEAGVEPMFLNIDESLGTVDAMNGDSEHETSCYGSASFLGGDNYMSIKGRGNSTWVFEKKPYNITFYKKADFDKKKSVELIEGVESKKWTLLANYLDSTLLRNKVAFDLAKAMGIGLDCRFVDVWMNGEYLGNYLLTPKKDYNAPAAGFMLENDHIEDNSQGNQFVFPNIAEMPLKHNRINIEDIGDDAISPETGEQISMSEIEAWFTEAWNTVLDAESEEYQKYFDLDSWAKMYLMFEVSKTYDCYAGNIIMTREGLSDGDKLKAGPAWDYDIAFGRTLHKFIVGVDEYAQLNAEGWYNDSIGVYHAGRPFSILQGLGMHDSFMQKVAEVYSEYRWAFEELSADVDRQRAVLGASADMDNARWYENHLGGDYVVAPDTLSVLGTGEYRLNYEVTLGYDNYVNNLREFCTKRVMWLTDHLCAEAPVGSITQTLVNGNTLVLRAELTAGNEHPSYCWQSSMNGVDWTDMEVGGSEALSIPVSDISEGVQYRCVVSNCAEINTVHGGRVTANTVSTALEPVRVNITEAEDEVPLCEGELKMVMNGRSMGMYTFAQVGGGWTLQDSDGKYLAADKLKLVRSDTPFVWSYDGGVFTAKVRVNVGITRLISFSYDLPVFLQEQNGGLSLSLLKGSGAVFYNCYSVIE